MVLLLLFIIIINIYLRQRRRRQSISTNSSHSSQERRIADITKELLDSLPVVNFRNPHLSDSRGRKEDVETGLPVDGSGPSEATSSSDLRSRSFQHEMTKEGNSSRAESTHQNSHVSGSPSCPICTDDFVHGEDLRLLSCGHQFHKGCVDPWLLKRSSTCPMCRSDFMATGLLLEGATGING